jgi:DNA-binding response OmpR family regulator
MKNDTRLEPRTGKLRVLILDDNRDFADSLARLVTLWGHDPRVAYDGTLALALARVFQPDVALLDLGLSDMDGYQVARALRRQIESRDVVLFALTGHAGRKTRRELMANGFVHYLMKPVEFERLSELLDKMRERIVYQSAASAGARD